MDFKALGLNDVVKALAFVTLFFALLLLAKWFKSLSISYHLNDQLVEHDNQAVGLAMAGYYLGTAAIFVGALVGPSEGLPQDLLTVGGYSLLGLIFLNLARWFNDIAMLRRFSDTEQLVKQRNVGVGAVHFGVYLATGLVAAGAVSGEGGGVVSALVFFVLGQLSLLVFSLIYERFSSYDIHAELQGQNVAAGVAFGGNLVALAILVMNASSGDFIDWKKDLTQFLTADLVAFVALPLIRLATDRVIIPGKSLGREIREDRNVGAGILEAALAIAFAVVLAFLI
jgi:uncharacterized membrane protein YjfL (UPF0719 family)